MSHSDLTPSAWVVRFSGRIAKGGTVLDVAAGSGRHTHLFLSLGHKVTAIDRDTDALATINHPDLELVTADLENGSPWPFIHRRFACVVVTNYLYRALFPGLVRAVAPGGLLIYETFAVGNERFGKPSNPEFLLRPGELLETVHDRMRVLAYEDLEVTSPKPAMVQRIAASRD
jgi:SAM-dependent methyltransferase